MPEAPANPFLQHRLHLDTYHLARRRGWSDQRWVDEVCRLDDRVAEIDGTGFRVTPLIQLGPGGHVGTAALGASLTGPVWAKVETANVSGSHKARHLFGLALALLLARGEGVGGGTGGRGAARPSGAVAELAIASCGNAALAAAIVARALGRPLRVIVPAAADPAVVERLDALGARVTPSQRKPGEVGDPCIRDLHQAIAGGAVPFTVQGTLCPGTFDGARTLGLELGQQLAEHGVSAAELFVQVGGGALAVATMEGLARSGGPLPVLHPVQASCAHPFVAAWARLERWRGARPAPPDPLHASDELGPLMQPWPVEPVSLATGILDDVTHDWLGVASWTLRTGGAPVLVDETVLAEAADLAGRSVAPPPDATGAAGFAGLLAARRTGEVDAARPGVVLLTGVDRGWERTAQRPRRRVEVPRTR